LNEIAQAKEDKKEAKAAQDDEGMGNTTVVLQGTTSTIDVS
jgi:hypothetical protein